MALTNAKRVTLATVFLFFSLNLLFSFVEGDDEPSPYEVLQRYNLPVGLLPNGALGYTLDPNTGRFSVNLTSNCKFRAGGYQVNYSPQITGVISQNTLREIGGVKVKVALFWIKIINVSRNQDRLEFNIGGFIKKNFPVNDFISCPTCR